MTRPAPVTERVLDACPRLRLVAVCAGSPAGVDLDAAKTRDVRVCHAAGCDAAAAAEHTLGLMLAVLRRLPWAGTTPRTTSGPGWSWRTCPWGWSATGPSATGSPGCSAPSAPG